MAADPDPADESDDYPVDPADLGGASDADLAALVADAWAAEGYRTTVKEHGSHVFVFAKRRVDGEIRGEIVWVAGERAVESAQLEQLRALAEKTGADSAACLTVGSGGVAGSAAATHDVTPLDGDDLRAKLGVDEGSDLDQAPDTPANDPPVGSGESDGGPDGLGDLDAPGDSDPSSAGEGGLAAPGDGVGPPDDETGGAADGPVPGADDGGEPDLDGDGAAGLDGLGDVGDGSADAAVDDGPTGAATDDGPTGAATDDGPTGATFDTPVGSGAGRRRLDAWDGQTTGADVDRPPFDGLWAAVTRGDAVETVADLSVWDGTSR
ncbi:ICP22 family protein [Halosimplex halophilum]|uniref:hypothetical protein n=1 Tax=Halosimplex halophilum TaxID=2559572 RepID=UPI00107F08CC|nr:hypothetical protein [Halosimplex halophilum]